MSHRLIAGLLIGSAFLVACSSEDPGETGPREQILTAATLGEQTILSNAEHLAGSRYASADVSRGKGQATLCRACHTLEAGAANMIGPNLHGMFGKQAGRIEGFAYSDVLADAEFVWTPRALDAWLAQPGRFLPGNRMTFPGIGDEGDRDDLIAYLLTVTDSAPQQ